MIPISLFLVRIKDEVYYVLNTIRSWNYRVFLGFTKAFFVLRMPF